MLVFVLLVHWQFYNAVLSQSAGTSRGTFYPESFRPRIVPPSAAYTPVIAVIPCYIRFYHRCLCGPFSWRYCSFRTSNREHHHFARWSLLMSH
ncbi:Uncharacterised protein [Vibrio cholerae]|nr:Uncharacterised protein [Vibrio cholerae]